MNDKTQGVKSLVEFKKVIVEFGDRINGFVEELSKLLNDIEIPDEEEDTWEMKYPFENGDEYYLLKSSGDFQKMEWTNHIFDELSLIQGNIFTTEEAVNLEVKRRKLLTRFRAFRNECNGDWEADWTNGYEDKFFISFNIFSDNIDVRFARVVNSFYIFGYFKNKEDAERAIELFGDEIKELFVEGE
ncbi:hypothetical protein O3796_03870 [Granulicatella adiacens]|uniref:hypothetical protein n=1 Tax=Granulicatella adiacens TaxID=46124 RepID=UPI00352F3739